MYNRVIEDMLVLAATGQVDYSTLRSVAKSNVNYAVLLRGILPHARMHMHTHMHLHRLEKGPGTTGIMRETDTEDPGFDRKMG